MKQTLTVIILIAGCMYSNSGLAAESSASTYNQKFSDSIVVERFFDEVDRGNTSVNMPKRLFYYLCVQAAQDPAFEVATFKPLVQTVQLNENDQEQISIGGSKAILLRNLLNYIPWNGTVENVQRRLYHELLLSDAYASIGIHGFSSKGGMSSTHIVSMSVAGDDFDSEVEQRTNVENAYKELYEKAQRSVCVKENDINSQNN